MSLVNSWNEWDPLQEVIVGTAQGAADIGYEPALSPYAAFDTRAHSIPQTLIDDAERQLDHFARLLEGLGIKVRRPDPVDHSTAFQTPDWPASGGHASACPRDLLLVIGNEIIEAPMTQRARYFEFRAYRRLLKEYFHSGARWTAVPKPLMRDDLYQPPTGELFDHRIGPLLTELEPAFDAACFTRMGRDIFWQPDLVSNDFGAAWLQRHLGSEFRVHAIRFDEKLPTHIDTTLVPLCPGLVLTNPARPCLDRGLQIFHQNGWRTIDAPPSVRTGRSPARDVSNWISMNILMLDPQTAVVEEAETPMADLLKSLKIDVVKCPFDRVYGFGGGFHCCTADVRREGRLESLFSAV